jgi:hypothetical protein
MKLKDYFDLMTDPLATARSRVIITPPGQTLTDLCQFFKERNAVELRISDLVLENSRLPMPSEMFECFHDVLERMGPNQKSILLLGLTGYLTLLEPQKKEEVIIALRKNMAHQSRHNVIFILLNDPKITPVIKNIFSNPRYVSSNQLVKIESNESAISQAASNPEIVLVENNLAHFIPQACETFQKYLRFTEDHPGDGLNHRIVVASEQPLPGLNVAVCQIMNIQDFAREFHGVDAGSLSDVALTWMCRLAKQGDTDKLLADILRGFFFPTGELTKYVLMAFDNHNAMDKRESLLWFLQYNAPKDSYLEYIVHQEGVSFDTFRSAYLTGASTCLGKSRQYAHERRMAVIESGVKNAEHDISAFIAFCKDEQTAWVAPWLNCDTAIEQAELLRRCAHDGIVPNAVKSVYPEVEAYLNDDQVFDNQDVSSYFSQYRALKMVNKVTPEFYDRAKTMLIPNSIPYRDALIQKYASDADYALLVVDGMGAEWLPMLVALARSRHIGIELVTIGKAFLPTITVSNKIVWSYIRFTDIKSFDNIAHNGVEAHEKRQPEENLAAQLAVIGNDVLPRVSQSLNQYERVILTADHGSSRLATLAWQSEPRLAHTLQYSQIESIDDWRYCRSQQTGHCPPEMQENLDGTYWIVRGYDRLSKQGGNHSFELHGGGSWEEILVPIVIFSRQGQFVPKAKMEAMRPQIVEKDDFDL